MTLKYITCSEIAQKYNVSRQNVIYHCQNGHIKGAFKLSGMWVIPTDAELPAAWKYGLKGRWAERKIMGVESDGV